MQREVYIPSTILNLSSQFQHLLSPDEIFANRLTEIIVQFANVLASIRDESVTDSLEIVSKSMRIDTDLAAWAKSLPASFAYKFKSNVSNPVAFENSYHVYPNL